MSTGAQNRQRETVVELAHAPGSANVARKQIASELRGLEVGAACVMDVEIVVAELVANATEHGRPDESGNVQLAWSVHSRGVSVSVRDHGDVVGLRSLPLSTAGLRGRGLSMVESICRGWTVEHLRPGTRVTAEIPYR